MNNTTFIIILINAVRYTETPGPAQYPNESEFTQMKQVRRGRSRA